MGPNGDPRAFDTEFDSAVIVLSSQADGGTRMGRSVDFQELEIS